MKRTRVLALIVMMAAAACGKKKEEPVTTGSNTATGSAGGSGISAASMDAPTPPITIDATAPPDAAPAAYTLPADATQINERGARKADATSVGADVTVHFVEKIADDTNDSVRHVDQRVALTGAASVVVDVGFTMDDRAGYKDVPHEGLRTVKPLDPPRPFAKDDAGAKLPFKGPLLYVKHWTTGEVAVAHDGDAIVVWRSQILTEEGEEGDGPEPFFEQARIKLAPGAKVTAR